MQTKSEIILAKICNNPLGRKFLGVPKNKRIYKITKYSAHFYTGESSKEGLPIISTGECVSNRKMKLFNWLETWKPIHLCWLFRRLNLKIPNYFIGADTGELAPGTTGNDTSVGTKEWYLTDNVKFEGGSPCLNTLGDSDLYSIKENSIKLVVGDAIVGDEKATDTYLPEESLTAVSYGGSAVLWGLSLTDTQVNASNFGFVYSVKTTAGTIETSYYLKVTNFNCSVPSGAIINGVTVKVVCCQHSYTPVYPQIDYVTLTVHYTGLSTSSTSISALSNLKSVCSSLILGKAQLVSTTIQTLLAKGNLGLPNLLSAKARIQNTKTKAITTKANIKETGVLTNISAKAQLIVMSYTTLSAKSNIIERERVENKLCYKLYEPDGTFIKVLSPDEIISNLTISRTINGGVGGVTISLKKPIDNYDEYDAVKNPTGAIKYGNRLKIFLTDRFNTDKQIFYGYLVAIGPQYTNGQETVVLTFYGAVSKLSNDYYNISGTPPYEPTEPAGFYVEETAESSSKIIKNILDNFILQTTNPMVSYIWGTTIDDCGNSVSYTFDRMKHLDTLKKIEEYLPTTWYWYVDGEGDLYVKDSSSQTEHTLVIGRDIAEIKSHKTIESVVNYFVFWNGRSTADASYVFDYDKNSDSQDDYGRITLFQQDSAVLSSAVSDIRVTKVLAYRKDPKQELTIEVTDKYNIAGIEPGHRICIRNLRDDLQTTFADGLVVKRISYKIDSALLELGQIGGDLTAAVSEEETLINQSISQAQSSIESIQAGDTPITEANIEYSGSSFIKEDVIYSPVLAGIDGYFRDTLTMGQSGIASVIKSYGKTDYADASKGFWLEKTATDYSKFEMYYDGDNYLRFNTQTGVLEISGDIVLGPGSTITWSQISDANPPNSADLSEYSNDVGWTDDGNLDKLREGILSGGTFISNKAIYSPIIAGDNGYFRDTLKVGGSGIGGLIASYGKSSYADSVAGFLLQKTSGGAVYFEVYGDATHYLRFNSGGSPTITIRGDLVADDLKSGSINATTITITNLNASNISTGTLSVDRLGATSIVVGKLASDATNRIFQNSTTKTNIEAWRHASDVTKIDGGDIYARSVTASQVLAHTITGYELTTSRIDTTEQSISSKLAVGAAITPTNAFYVSGNADIIGVLNCTKLGLDVGTSNPSAQGDIVCYDSGGLEEFRGQPGGAWTGTFDMTAY